MTRIGRHHVLALSLVAGAVSAFAIVASQSPPSAPAYAAAGASAPQLTATQVYTSNATWAKPVDIDHVVVETWGGGGGGGGGGGTSPTNGGTGGTSSFGSFTSSTGGQGGFTRFGAGGSGGIGSGDTHVDGTNGTAGWSDSQTINGGPGGNAKSGPYGSGTGGALTPLGTTGNAGNSYGGGGSGGGASGRSAGPGGGGGGGGYASKQISEGDLPSTVSVQVGAAGSSGQPGGSWPNGAWGMPGGAGAAGLVVVYEYTNITCTLSPSSQTITNGAAATLNYTISGSATSASINGVSVSTASSGTYSPSPASDTSYTMTVSNSGGSNTCGPVTVNVQGQSDVITGWAWSDTIGWISMNGTGYGSSIDVNGKLSGYAWSDNIGWVSANDTDLTGCPHTPCTAKLQSNALNGWLKALSADGNGWDGWISLSGASPSYGVTKNADGTFTGYAWGSDVVGWVDFSLARTGYQVCAPSTTYTCDNSSTIASTTVTSQCVTSVTHTTCTAPYFCSTGSSTCLNSQVIYNGGGNNLSGHLQAVPSLVPSDNPIKLFWNLSNVKTCTVSGTNNDGPWTVAGTSQNSWTSASPTGGQPSSSIIQQTVYTLICTKLDNTTISETATVNIVPVFQER